MDSYSLTPLVLARIAISSQFIRPCFVAVYHVYRRHRGELAGVWAAESAKEDINRIGGVEEKSPPLQNPAICLQRSRPNPSKVEAGRQD